MRVACWVAAIVGALGVCAGTKGADYMVGADMSFLGQAEAQGTVFKDGGVATPGLQIFKNHGYNWIRLRLFNDPAAAGGRGRLPNDLAYTIKMAQDAKKLGFRFLLDFHYADTWADPGKQPIPAAWRGKSHAELVTALHDYSRDTIAAFREAGVMPEMVQVGNEITHGMLWPDGRLGKGDDGWDHLTDFLKAGIAGVKEGAGDVADSARPRIMIHIDRGGDKAGTKYFFDKVVARGIEFDVIGQSYYPWWHGSLLDLRENLAFMAETYKKDIVVVECAYNWGPAEYRTTPAPFAESPEGQAAFLEAVNDVVMQTPGGLGKGIFWWEPAVPLRPGLMGRGMFDAGGNALPVLSVFDKWTRGKTPARASGGNGGAQPASRPATAPGAGATRPG